MRKNVLLNNGASTGSRQKRFGMEDVAALANVSSITVSRAFSGTAPVAEKTRQRIMEAARKLDFRPHPLASGLRGGRTRTIGVIWELARPSTVLLHGITQSIRGHGSQVLIADDAGKPEHIIGILDELIQRRVDGVIMRWSGAGTRDIQQKIVNQLRQFRSAVVVTGYRHDLSVDQVVHDATLSIRQTVDHFVAVGRRKLACLIYFGSNQFKIDAFVAQVRSHGLCETVIPYREQTTLVKIDDVPVLLDKLYHDKPFEADALLCSNDVVAMGAMMWLRSRGLRIPEDVAITGRDEVEVAKAIVPPLATVCWREPEVAKAIDDVLMARLADPDLPVQVVEIPMEFVPRESAG